ncbi:MAG: restriction endonuclease [Desulfobacteraceae bacterium 4572_87]|nr:MAG: restriction endonuclease [Desulfobacteraceae bacterium 4572_87]
MKIVRIEYLIRKGSSSDSEEIKGILEEINRAVSMVVWPDGSDSFTLYSEKKANGVVPIKKNFMEHLSRNHWWLEKKMEIASRMRPGKIDAVKAINDGRFFAVEWETGNISSSHRALNKMAVGLLDGMLVGGVLVLPSRRMYQYLTDRVGNFQEIEPYFPMWRNLSITDGLLAVIEIEYDAVSLDSPQIKKGTNGRALR